MIIKNRDKLSITALRSQALDILEAGISRVLPANVMNQAVKFNPSKKILSIEPRAKIAKKPLSKSFVGSRAPRRGVPIKVFQKSPLIGCPRLGPARGIFDYDISKGRIFVIGGGKASGLMAQSLENLLGPGNITAGIVNCKNQNFPVSKIQIVEASHPTPDHRGVWGVEQMLALKDQFSIDEKDLVICLISGGGSALMPCPVKEITLKDKQAMTKLLIENGPAIQEINAVRKHLSGIKGGRLGKFFAPTPVVSLIISDVVGNDLDAIASGPTVPDSSTFPDAYQVLKKYKLLPAAPPRIVDYLEKGCAGQREETPKKLDNCCNFIIGDNRMALEAMAFKAEELGLRPYIVTAEQKGDPGEMARLRATEILNSTYKDYDVILIGGETTPRLPVNHGMGGRNQHYAAISMVALKDYPGEWVMASLGTDGADYLEDIAGALVDKNSLNTAGSKKIEIQPYLERYDSRTLLEKIGNSLIRTGNTGTNVGDVAIYIFIR